MLFLEVQSFLLQIFFKIAYKQIIYLHENRELKNLPHQ